MKKETIIKILDTLDQAYPDAECELDFTNTFELIVAVCLSAQTTDKSVNKVTPALFAKYPNAHEMSMASEEEIAEIIHTIGLYKNKSKNVLRLAKDLVEKYDGEVPNDFDKLVELPGVGRKTANVVLSVGFGEQRIAVDTHVFRVANRIGLVKENDVLKTELALMKAIPKERWTKTHHDLIFHGRRCCDARKPNCDACPILEYCRYIKK